MLYQQDIFIGVDVSAGKRPYTTAVLDLSGNLLALETCSMDGIIKFTGGYQIVKIAVNSPRELKTNRIPDTHFDLISENDLQEASTLEYQVSVNLRKAGYRRISTLNGITIPSARLKNGQRLFDCLEGQNSILEGGIIVVNAHACYTMLLGRNPLMRSSTEGRIQRQLALILNGIRLKDPMDYFEEITKFRLLQGLLPEKMLYSSRQLDALVSAFTARLEYMEPLSVHHFGDGSGGTIHCPAMKQ